MCKAMVVQYKSMKRGKQTRGIKREEYGTRNQHSSINNKNSLMYDKEIPMQVEIG